MFRKGKCIGSVLVARGNRNYLFILTGSSGTSLWIIFHMTCLGSEEETERMWSGLKAITDYKGSGYSETQSSVLLPDELNAFYVRFERDSDRPAVELPEGLASGVSTLTELRHCFKKINPCKAPGPDGISGRALRGCADQLAGVFSDIFNLSLSLSVLP